MATFLLFLACFCAVAGITLLAIAAVALFDPFVTGWNFLLALLFLMLCAPWAFTSSINFAYSWYNYCPPCEPIAEPDLAAPDYTPEGYNPPPPAQVDPAFVVENLRVANGDLGREYDVLEKENKRLANELSLRTTALTTASETIVTLQKNTSETIVTLQKQVKQLANEVSLKTTALNTASETIRTLQNIRKALNAQLVDRNAKIEVLESTRIKVPAASPIVVPTAAPAASTCHGHHCPKH